MILVVLMVVGCAAQSESGFEAALHEMRDVTLAHAADAARIVESQMEIPPGTLETHWVLGVMPIAPGGETIAGVAIDCELWVSWWGAQWLSGSSTDGPTISHTAFAHEAAHCALFLRGEDDPNHTRNDWWGAGGAVERAQGALVAAGL